MSLLTCPECAHEVSSSATACPNCGHPFVRPTAPPPRVVVQEFVEEDSGFPKWAFIPIGLLGVVLLFVLFAFMRNGNDEEAQRNVNVRIAGQTNSGNSVRETAVRPESPPNQVLVPPSSQPSSVNVPTTTTTLPPAASTTTTVPSTATALPPDKGTVNLEAKVLSRGSSQPQPVRGTRFYLLKKNTQTVLDDADIDNDSGQDLLTAIGMGTVDPSRYGTISRQAMSAISQNAAYNITTDASGKASLKDVKPDQYYLFAVAKSGNGFVLWNSQVTIEAGQNALVLPPANPTELMPE